METDEVGLLNDKSSTGASIGAPDSSRLGVVLHDLHQKTRSAKLAACFDRLSGPRLQVLHGHQIPGTKTVIDHIAISASGIYVIDSKEYPGKVVAKDVGGWFKTDSRLFVGRRDRTHLVQSMDARVDAVWAAMSGMMTTESLAITPVICLPEADWTLVRRPLVIDGVIIGWLDALAQMIQSQGPLNAGMIRTVAAELSRRLASS